MNDNSAVEHAWWTSDSTLVDTGDHPILISQISNHASMPQLNVNVTVDDGAEAIMVSLQEFIDALPKSIKAKLIKNIKLKRTLENY